MQMLILNTEQQTALAALNASGNNLRQLQPAPLAGERSGLNPDLLTDCGPGQTWEHYAGLLQSLGGEETVAAPGPVTLQLA